MSDDIELGLLGVTPSTSSETLFDRSRVHKGYGASKLPLKPSLGAGLSAGSGYQHIFEGQLGQAASSVKWFPSRDKYYSNLPSNLRLSERKPYGVPWTKASKKQYSKHWKLVNPRSGSKPSPKQVEANKNLNRGYILPFSRNIGPGNTIQSPKTGADAIAAGHDLHYQHATQNKDILSADREAISHFAHETVNSGDPISQIQAAIGLVGLGAKHSVEKLTGKVYYGKYVTTISKTSSLRAGKLGWYE